MSEDTAKIRFKSQDLEIECEARESFLLSDLSELLEKLSEFLDQRTVTRLPDSPPAIERDYPTGSGVQGEDEKRTLTSTTKAIATRMNATTAADLVMAAAARLVLVDTKETFTRKELLAEAKTVTGHYKKSVSNNLSRTLTNLVGARRLNETATNTYAVPAPERQKLETWLRD